MHRKSPVNGTTDLLYFLHEFTGVATQFLEPTSGRPSGGNLESHETCLKVVSLSS